MIGIIVVLVDQVSKVFAVANLSDGQSIEVLGSFFMLTLVYNRGGAMGTDFGSSNYYLISSILIMVFVLYYLYISRHNKFISWPLAFIAGGAIGNIIDRIHMGRVVDFLDVDFFDINVFGYQLNRWWTFNIADAAITCAIVFIIVSVLFFPSKHAHKPPETE